MALKKRISLVLLLTVLLSLCMPFRSSAEEERPVLTIGDVSDRSSVRMDGKDQLGLWQYLEDRLGVEIRFVYLTPEAYAAGLSSGDLPDIVATDNNLAAILECGAALNVDPYLQEYVPNFLTGETRLAYDVFKQLLNEGDGFYFFPQKIGYNGVGYSNDPYNRGYIVRWDYYRELGYPPINNEDDYVDVLLQMHDRHPFTEEGYPTYLYGCTNFKGYATAFRSELSLDYWAAYKYQNNIFTNEIFDGYLDTERSMYWTTMSFYNKLYLAGKEDGAFDLELFTQTSEQFEAKCARGQYLGLVNGKNSLYDNKVKTDPDTLAGYASVPTAAANQYTNAYQLLGNGSLYMWFISANSPHKEEALGLFNYMCDPYFLREAMMGEYGVTWDYDGEGAPRMTEYGQAQLDEYCAGNPPSDNYYVQWGNYSIISSCWPLLRDNALHPDGYPLDFATISREYEIAAMTSNISRDICEHYGVELPSDAWYAAGGLDFRNDCGEAITSCMSSLNMAQLQVLSEAEELLNDVCVDLVLSETDAEFTELRDRTLRRLTEMGEAEVFKAYQLKWDAAAAVIVPLVREAQIANGVQPYTPEQYQNHCAGTEGQA